MGLAMIATLRELYQYRDVLYMLVWREVKIRYKQSILAPRGRY